MSKRRYVQVQNQAGKWELIEVGEPERGVARLQIMGAAPHENYRSPIDGSVISSRRSERYHMDRHQVVRPGDFGNNEGREYFDRVRRERQDFYDGKSSSHRKEIRNDVVETVQRLSQGQKPVKPRTGDE